MAKMSLHKKTSTAAPRTSETIAADEVGSLPEGIVDAVPEIKVPTPAARRTTPAAGGALVALASIAGQDTALAAVFEGNDETNILPQEPPGAYVMFAHPMSKKYPLVVSQCPGLKTFDPVLLCGSERPIRLVPFRCHFVTGWQFWGRSDSEGNVEEVSLTKPAGRSGLTEHINAVLLVHTPDGVRAATCRFKVGTAKVGSLMASTLAASKTPEWGSLSPAHRETLALKPFMRAVYEVSVSGRTSKSSGNQYAHGEATAAPTTAADVRALGAYFSSPEGAEDFGRVWDAFNRHKDEVSALAE